jgi:hypothetical protein
VEFGFEGGKGLQEELAGVSEGDGVLARYMAGDLVDKEFAEDDVDRGGGLEIADRRQDIGSDQVAASDAAHFAIEMMMAKGGVTRIVSGSAAFAIGAKVLATAVGHRWSYDRRGSRRRASRTRRRQTPRFIGVKRAVGHWVVLLFSQGRWHPPPLFFHKYSFQAS